jgi:hypothetical protein
MAIHRLVTLLGIRVAHENNCEAAGQYHRHVPNKTGISNFEVPGFESKLVEQAP